MEQFVVALLAPAAHTRTDEALYTELDRFEEAKMESFPGSVRLRNLVFIPNDVTFQCFIASEPWLLFISIAHHICMVTNISNGRFEL